MKKTFNIWTLGCKVNQYESEAVEEIFLKKGYKKVESGADIHVINTCTVTNMSDRKSRQMISRARKDNPDGVIAVMGCYSQVKPEEVKKIEGVDIILGSRNKEEVVGLCEEILKDRGKIVEVGSFSKESPIEELEISKQNEMTRAYIKIQDGCNMYCSYCLIPYARGNIVSRDLEDIYEEAERLGKNGYKEVVLTGIHVASFGKDLGGGISLIDAIEKIAEIPEIERIRLSSMEPRHITGEFLERMKATGKACDHFHLSLQSGSDHVLSLMNRKYDTELFRQKVDLIREVFPNAGLTTDIIVGFPGESDKDFKDTLNFVKEINFSKVHIFKYSKRDGTKAAEMPCQVDGNIKKERAQVLAEVEEKNRKAFLQSQLGKTLEVLFESEREGDFSYGYSTNYLRVKARGAGQNDIRKVLIRDLDGDTLMGEIV